MKLKMMLPVMLGLFVFVGMAQAQQPYTAVWYWYNDNGSRAPLTDGCVSGTPFPDGTPIQFVWDSTANGPDDNDRLPTVCTGDPCPSTTVNFNQYPMNGVATGDGAGFFQMDVYFQAYAPFTPPRFFLRVCGTGMRWQSQVFVLSPGAQEFQPSQITWTCLSTPCPGCETPNGPSPVLASDNRCDGVNVTWGYVTGPTNNGYAIYRAGTRIATIADTSIHQYLDTGAAESEVSYGVKVRHICSGTDSSESSLLSDLGQKLPAPPLAQTVVATDINCGNVIVNWTFTTTAGLGWWVITRAGDSVGTVNNSGGPGARTFTHTTPLGGQAQYCVRGASAACGWGTPGCDNGTALQAPPQVQNVAATDGVCNVTTVTWTDVAGETGYSVTRDGVNVSGTLPANTISWPDPTGAGGIVYVYRVQGSNTCGLSTNSAPDNGNRLIAPVSPIGFSATDSTSCTGVVLTWTDVANETYYKILRSLTNPPALTDSIGNVGAGVITYTDLTAVPGTVYWYAVAAANACGATSSTSNQGSRKGSPGQVTGVLASDTSCANIFIKWNNLLFEDSFRVYRNSVQIGNTVVNDTDFVDATAVAGSAYAYTIQALRLDCGNGAVSLPDSGHRLTGLTAVLAVSATDNRCDSVVVTWTALAGATQYVIRRDGAQVGTATGTRFALQPPTGTSTYRVIGQNACGLGDTTGNDLGTRLPLPGTVTNVAATDTRCDSIIVIWTAVSGATQYRIRRDGAQVGTTTGTRFAEQPNPGTYTYRVVAENTCGLGDSLGTDSGTRLTTPAQVTGVIASENSCALVLISWANVADEDTFRVLRDGVQIGFTLADDLDFEDTGGTAGQTYSYTVIAANECGAGVVSAGENGTRLVAPTPPTVIASDTSCAGINVVWSGAGGDVDSFRVYRNVTTLITTEGPLVASFFDVFVEIGTASYTVASVSNECGASTASNAAGGTRLTPAGTPPSLDVTENRCDSTVATWVAASGDVDGYRIFEGVTQIADVPPTPLRFAYVPSVGNYNYTIVAYSTECGPGAASAPEVGGRAVPPTAASNLQASTIFCDRIDFSWIAGSGGIDGYIIYRDDTDIDTVDAGTTNYSDTGASVGSHNYYVVAYSVSCPDAEPSNTDDGQRVAFPTAPANVAASDTSCALVYVFWDAIAEPLAYYVIYADGDSIGSTTGTSFNYAPTPGITYSYTVKARSSCGLSAVSTADNGQRLPGAGVPTNLSASDNDCDAILLTWNTASGFIEEYRIYRDGSFLIAQSAPDTTYSDVVTAGVTHDYEVSAFNSGCGETARSVLDQGMRRPLLSQVLGLTASTDNCAGIALSWTGQAGASKYYIYRNTALIDSVNDPTTTYLDTGVAPGGSATYNVSAVNVCGAGTQSADAIGSRPPTPLEVTTVDATSDSCRRITVTWSNVTGETGYVILRDYVAIDSVGPDVLLYYDRLAGAHTYHVLSKNICGNSALADSGSATAPDLVLPPTNVVATDNNCDNIVVTWTASANALSYTVWRNGNLLVSDITEPSVTDTPVPGTYVYDVVSENTCGLSVAVADSGRRRGAPAQVAGLTASDTSCTQICLTWNNVADEDSFRIYRDGDNFLAWVAANVTNYCDATATIGTHTYYVVAANVCNSATQSTTATGTRNTVPGQVQDFAASTNNCAGVVLTWTDLATESSYAIFRDENPTPIAAPAQNATTYTDNGVAMGSHTYTIHGVNACGNGQGPDASATGARRDVPGVVTGVQASDGLCNGVLVIWTDIVNEDGYRIYRSDNPDVPIGSVAADVTTYNDVSGTPETTYTYCVGGWNACGDGLHTACDQGTAQGPPPQVTTVNATDNSSVNVVITWDNVVGELGYTITRTPGGEVNVGPETTSYTDVPTPGTYQYCVTSYNECGPAPQPVCDSGTRIGVPPAVTTVSATDDHCNDIVVTWNDVTNEDGYKVVRNADTTLVAANLTSYTDTPPAGTYTYRVYPYNGAGNSPSSPSDNGTRLTVPGQVTGVSATDTRCDNIQITWTTNGSVSYNVYRDGTNLVGNYATPPATDTQPPGTHSYTVKGVNTCGEGPVSGADNGTRLAAPVAPTSVVASDNLCGTVHITWVAGGGVVDTFQIKRGTTIVGQVNENVFVFDDPAPAGTYAYTVVAHSNGQVCPDATSAADNGTSHSAPGVPTNLAAAAPNCTSVNLTWTASTGEVTGYSIFRDSDSLTSVATTTYSDASLLDNDNHNYQVRAYNSFCAPSNLTGSVIGRMRELLLAPTIPATVLCEDTITVNLDHCAGVTSDTVAISINGGAYVPLTVFSPVQAQVDIIIPDVQQTMPNNRLRIISTRGARRDTVITDPFTIECLAANDQISEIPTDYVLDQNYPNPFNPSTTIKFGLPVSAEVMVEVFDVQGRKAATLVDGQTLQPGWHSVVWDCSQCPSGMYLVRMQAGERTMLRKMLLMK